MYLTDDRGENMLVDVRGEGDYFGVTSLLQKKPAMFDIIAQQDLITLTLPAAELQQLVKKYPVFQRYFGASLARTIQAVRDSSAYCQPRLIMESAVNLDVFMTGKRVADLCAAPDMAQMPDFGIFTDVHFCFDFCGGMDVGHCPAPDLLDYMPVDFHRTCLFLIPALRCDPGNSTALIT